MKQKKLVDEINEAISRICLEYGFSSSGLNVFADGDFIRARFTISDQEIDSQKIIGKELARRKIMINDPVKPIKSFRDGRSYKLVRINHDNNNLPFVVADTVNHHEFLISEQTLKELLAEND